MLLTKGFHKKIAISIISLIISNIGYAIVSVTPGQFWFMAIAVLIQSIPIPKVNISFRTILQTVVPMDIQGRVMSLVISLASLASPLGMILSGAFASYVGTSNLFLGSALVGILITVSSWFLTELQNLEEMQSLSEQSRRASLSYISRSP